MANSVSGAPMVVPKHAPFDFNNRSGGDMKLRSVVSESTELVQAPKEFREHCPKPGFFFFGRAHRGREDRLLAHVGDGLPVIEMDFFFGKRDKGDVTLYVTVPMCT